jgi:hypothetical protein
MNDREALQALKPHADAIKAMIDTQLATAPAAPIETPSPGPGSPPPGTGTLPPGAQVDHDFGTGGGEVWPHADQEFPAHTWITIAFTTVPGMNPQLDVFPGTGNWVSGNRLSDIFPDVMAAAETYACPIGNNKMGRGTENGPGVPIECYAAGPHRYSVMFDKPQRVHFQVRMTVPPGA